MQSRNHKRSRGLTRNKSTPKRHNQRLRSLVSPPMRLINDGAYVPPTHRTSLRFGIGFSAAASGTYANAIVSSNNLNDPGLALSSNKCVGYSFWASMYKRYRVIGSKIRVRGAITSSATAGVTQIAGTFCVYPSPNGTTLNVMADALSQPYSKAREVNSSQAKTITSAISTSKLSGQKDVIGSDKLEGIVGAAPSEEGYWVVAYVADAAYTNGQMAFDLDVTYDVIFSDRQDNNRSVTKHFDAALDARIKLIKEQKSSDHKSSDGIVLKPLQVESKEEPEAPNMEDYYEVPALLRTVHAGRQFPRSAPQLSAVAPPPTPSKLKV